MNETSQLIKNKKKKKKWKEKRQISNGWHLRQDHIINLKVISNFKQITLKSNKYIHMTQKTSVNSIIISHNYNQLHLCNQLESITFMQLTTINFCVSNTFM